MNNHALIGSNAELLNGCHDHGCDSTDADAVILVEAKIESVGEKIVQHKVGRAVVLGRCCWAPSIGLRGPTEASYNATHGAACICLGIKVSLSSAAAAFDFADKEHNSRAPALRWYYQHYY